MENQDLKKAIQDFSDKAQKYNGKPCKEGCNCLEIAEYKALGGVKEYPCLDNSKHLEMLKPLRGMENQQTPEGKTLQQCKDEVAVKHGYNCWINLIDLVGINEHTVKYEQEAYVLFNQYDPTSKIKTLEEVNAKLVEANKELQTKHKLGQDLIDELNKEIDSLKLKPNEKIIVVGNGTPLGNAYEKIAELEAEIKKLRTALGRIELISFDDCNKDKTDEIWAISTVALTK